MSKSFSYSQPSSTFRLINQSIKIHLAQRTNLFKKMQRPFTTSMIDIFFNNNQSCLSQKRVWSKVVGIESQGSFTPGLSNISCAKSLQLCPSLCNSKEGGPPGSSVHSFKQEYWSGLPCPPPKDLPNSGTELTSLMSPALAGRFFTTSTTWESLIFLSQGQNDVGEDGNGNRQN